MKIKAWFIYVNFLLVIQSFGQQDPMYSMYMFDKVLINPAYAGSSNWAVGTLKYRQQFIGFGGNPVTQTFNFHSPIQSKHIGVGLKVVNDKMAVLNTLNATLQVSYHLNFAGGKLSLGIDGGVYNRRIDYQKLIVSTKGDNALSQVPVSSTIPDISYGMYYQKNQFYVGFSEYHLLKKDFNDRTLASSGSHLYKHIYILAGNVFTLNKYWNWEPNMLMKWQPGSALQFDFNAMLYYQDRFGAGIQYRTGDALAAVLKVNILENLRVTFSYDYTLSKLSRYSTGACEVLISYGIKLPPPPVKKEIHPRYYF
ncbi:MAG: type IX secretion system membrane protein PorP/SprF [Bacteroidetes bacterium]|nr:type IX secretion system membrane protein PorP/SprF [Bacteroidota bacterium]